MSSVYAVFHRDGVAADAPKTIPAAGAQVIRRYPVQLGGDLVGIASLCKSKNEPAIHDAGGEALVLDDGCIAQLLADAVQQLAAGAEDGDPMDEPELLAKSGGKRSAGLDDQGCLTIREPAGHFAGYEHSYAKGRVDPGETRRQAARRELMEETGLTGRVVGTIGDFKGQTGITRFYIGVRTGGKAKRSAETQAIKTVSPFTAMELLNVQRDKDVLVRLVELAASMVEWQWTIGSQRWRCRLIDGRVVGTRAGGE